MNYFIKTHFDKKTFCQISVQSTTFFLFYFHHPTYSAAPLDITDITNFYTHIVLCCSYRCDRNSLNLTGKSLCLNKMSAKGNFIDADTSVLDSKLRFVKVYRENHKNIHSV